MGQKNDDKDTNGITDLLEARDIKNMIYTIRGQQVMLDSDLAMLYQVETGVVNRAVKRNKERFPEDFCFQLTEEEFLRCQIGISKTEGTERRGGRRYMPYVFTELGISMLSSILRSDVAVFVSIGIMRAFVEISNFLMDNVGSETSIRNVSNKLTSGTYKTNDKTVGSYMDFSNDKVVFFQHFQSNNPLGGRFDLDANSNKMS